MTEEKQNPWIHYQGEYEKKHYDIMTIDGKQYDKCWPNAGKFHTQDGQTISGGAVGQIRITKNIW